MKIETIEAEHGYKEHVVMPEDHPLQMGCEGTKVFCGNEDFPDENREEYSSIGEVNSPCQNCIGKAVSYISSGD